MSWQRRFLDLRPLRTSRPFRALWVGASLGSLGHQVATVAVLAQVWEMTGSPVWTGTIGLATAVPMVVFGLLGGVLADAVDRRTVVWVTAAGQLLAALALWAQAGAGNQSVLLLLALVAGNATFAALGGPARRTFPVRLLPPDLVAAGLALKSIAFQASMLVGPALAGVVLGQWGHPAAYALQAGASAVALLAVVRLPRMPVLRPDADGAGPAAAPATRWATVRARLRARRPARGGWRVLLRRPRLWGTLATDLSATLLAMPVALFPLVNEVRFDGDPHTLGLFLSAVAVGGIAAGLVSGSVTRIRRGGLVQLTAAATWGLALAGFGLAEPLWLALGCLAVAGAADTISVITRSALIQLETPDEYRGRVSSAEHVIGVAGPEVGNFRAGLVASATSAPVALVVGGLAASAGVGLVALTNRPLRTYRTPPPTPEDRPTPDDQPTPEEQRPATGPAGGSDPAPTLAE